MDLGLKWLAMCFMRDGCLPSFCFSSFNEEVDSCNLLKALETVCSYDDAKYMWDKLCYSFVLFSEFARTVSFC